MVAKGVLQNESKLKCLLGRIDIVVLNPAQYKGNEDKLVDLAHCKLKNI